MLRTFDKQANANIAFGWRDASKTRTHRVLFSIAHSLGSTRFGLAGCERAQALAVSASFLHIG